MLDRRCQPLNFMASILTLSARTITLRTKTLLPCKLSMRLLSRLINSLTNLLSSSNNMRP